LCVYVILRGYEMYVGLLSEKLVSKSCCHIWSCTDNA